MLLKYEQVLWTQGINYIAGVDEVGRGPLAGPFVVAAVILNHKHLQYLVKSLNNQQCTQSEQAKWSSYRAIKDSKKVRKKKLKSLSDFILNGAICYSIIKIEHNLIDRDGISKTTQNGFFAALETLETKPQHVLTDRFKISKINDKLQTNITKGDSQSISIAAASIIAKVYRDDIMIKMHEKYPEYGFDRHKGYGTKAHREAIAQYGPCEIHRKSFEPVKSFLAS